MTCRGFNIFVLTSEKNPHDVVFILGPCVLIAKTLENVTNIKYDHIMENIGIETANVKAGLDFYRGLV